MWCPHDYERSTRPAAAAVTPMRARQQPDRNLFNPGRRASGTQYFVGSLCGHRLTCRGFDSPFSLTDSAHHIHFGSRVAVVAIFLRYFSLYPCFLRFTRVPPFRLFRSNSTPTPLSAAGKPTARARKIRRSDKAHLEVDARGGRSTASSRSVGPLAFAIGRGCLYRVSY